MPKQDYLFRRKNSKFWQLRLVEPEYGPGHPRKTKYVTTGHEVYDDALAWATPRILMHLRAVALGKTLFRMVKDETTTQEQYEAFRRYALYGIGEGMDMSSLEKALQQDAIFNRTAVPDAMRINTRLELEAGVEQPSPDGGKLVCSKDGKMIAVFDASGDFITTRPNKISGIDAAYMGDDRTHRDIRTFEARVRKNNPELGTSLDERMIESWVTHERPEVEVVKEMRRAYLALKDIAPLRNFGTFRPQDVQALVRFWIDKKNATSTMAKRMGLLSAVVHHAMDNARKANFPDIKNNVFVGDYVPKGFKGSRPAPRPFDPADHALIMSDLPNWPLDQQRLYLLGRCLGLSAAECWQITEEETVEGVRCVVVQGTKNDYRLRNIPIPEALLPYLPAKITGSLFKHGESYVNRKMMERIRELLKTGDTKLDGKTHHSLRHGLETDLGNLGVHPLVVSAILGHVPDDLKMNKGENNEIRRGKTVRYQYFHGNKPGRLLDALNLIKLHLGSPGSNAPALDQATRA